LDKEPRKATDVLFDLERKIDQLLTIARTQDFTIKILSNKLNSVMEALDKKPSTMPTVEAVNAKPYTPVSPFQQTESFDSEKQIPISSDDNLPLENTPSGFRRSSRPETFAGDNAYLTRPNVPEASPKFPVQIPKAPPGRGAQAEIVVPNSPVANKNKHTSQNVTSGTQLPVVQNAVPIIQRVVDKFSKSVFLADVEILDKNTMNSIFKTRTNGTGKWMASLPVGEYRIIVRKRESLTKEKVEVGQNIQVDGLTSPLELQTMIIK